MLIENKKWVAMFSHTGNEIYNISRMIGRFPDRVITNKTPGDKSINKKLISKTDVVYVKDRPDVQDYNRVLWSDCVLTLHGWMRVLPKTVCKEYEIYNLHPGLITKYPDLKGADPQRRVFECDYPEQYEHVGCVIHHVSPEVDSGKVVMERSTSNTFAGCGVLTEYLHKMATDMWVDFMMLSVSD
jgi:folate-dependent phosphoribosylglycinamide formyltransferase PurN